MGVVTRNNESKPPSWWRGSGPVPELTGCPMLTLLFALLAGILTVAAPCTLPVLPVLFGTSIGQTSKARPVFIALGFVSSFTLVTIVFSAITQLVGIDPDRLRTVAIGLLFIFGFLMLWPRPFEWLWARASGLLNRVHRIPVRAEAEASADLSLVRP